MLEHYFDQMVGGVARDVIETNAASSKRGAGGEVRRVSLGADTKANTWGSGSLEVGDLRLLEDGGERRGALISNLILSETVSEG